MNEEAPGYDAIDFDGTERRANYRTIAYREDMVCIFGRKDAAAIIYQIIYRWQIEVRREVVLSEMNRRKKAGIAPLTPEEAEDMMWVYMSYNDFVRESGHAIGYNTVIRMLDYLSNDIKIIEQRENHDPHYPDYEYRVNKDIARTLLKTLPAEPLFIPKIPKKKEDSTHLGREENTSTQMGTRYTQEGTAATHLGREVYPFGGTSHSTHRNTHTTHIPPILSHMSNDNAKEKEVSFTNASSQQKGVPPKQEKPTKERKPRTPKLPHQFTLTARACITAWNDMHAGMLLDEQEQKWADDFEKLATIIDTSNNEIQLTDIKRTKDDLDAREYNGKYYFRGRVTPKHIVEHIQAVTTALTTPSKPTNGKPPSSNGKAPPVPYAQRPSNQPIPGSVQDPNSEAHKLMGEQITRAQELQKKEGISYKEACALVGLSY